MGLDNCKFLHKHIKCYIYRFCFSFSWNWCLSVCLWSHEVCYYCLLQCLLNNPYVGQDILFLYTSILLIFFFFCNGEHKFISSDIMNTQNLCLVMKQPATERKKKENSSLIINVKQRQWSERFTSYIYKYYLKSFLYFST